MEVKNILILVKIAESNTHESGQTMPIFNKGIARSSLESGKIASEIPATTGETTMEISEKIKVVLANDFYLKNLNKIQKKLLMNW
jgi:hypothetical protein